jgi:hypothetical protein
MTPFLSVEHRESGVWGERIMEGHIRDPYSPRKSRDDKGRDDREIRTNREGKCV